ncbi:hypothetical protein ABEB36_004977 [Hypothenemus hampei]
MQLCNFSIGEFVTVSFDEPQIHLVQKVWPTTDKTLTSVLLTENCIRQNSLLKNKIAKVAKLNQAVNLQATQLDVLLVKGPKNIQLSEELNKRLSNAYADQYVTKDSLVHLMFYGTELKFQIKRINKKNNELCENLQQLSINDTKFYLITCSTKWKIFGSEESLMQLKSPIQVAGLDQEAEEVCQMIASVFQESLQGFNRNKSVLFYGHSGTGKTSLAKMIGQRFEAKVIEISALEVYSNTNNGNGPDAFIKNTYNSAIEKAPSIVVIDDIEVLCPSSTKTTEWEKKVTFTLINCLDEIFENPHTRVFTIATTNKIDSLYSGLRRCGRLDREIEIPTPNPATRNAILKQVLSKYPQNLSQSHLNDLSLITHGYVGADLVSLCSEAALICTKRSSTELSIDDLKKALQKIKPSAMREVQVEVPNVKWTDIGGQDRLKLVLKQTVEWPLKYSNSFKRLGITPPKGVLMFGPPGCSKTMIAKALATESGLNFLSIKGPELLSKWVGESERAVREVFRKARQVAPSILFFDEIDAIGSERSGSSNHRVDERVLAQLLTELDGITPLTDVMILAATNRPDKIDQALLRPGRLDRIVYVPLPDESTRRDIFRIKFIKIPVEKDVDLEELVKKTDGYSGAEVNAVCHEAAMFALEDDLNIESVHMRHFLKALKLITPRTSESLLEIYKDYNKSVLLWMIFLLT